MNYILHTLSALFLTLITQVGGFVYILSLFLYKKKKLNSRRKFFLIFITLYLVISLLVIPLTAPLFGRMKIKNNDAVKPHSWITTLLNRNYVTPDLHNVLHTTAKNISKSNDLIQIQYLDASFPFGKFPLLPHLSHNDGRKIDISFIYENKEGQISRKKKSISGYGAFSGPTGTEYNQINKCKSTGYWQYDYPKYLTLGKINSELIFSLKGTKILVEEFLKHRAIKRLFIEPHLKSRMKLDHKKIRYHGCRAVRHDDHIHLEVI